VIGLDAIGVVGDQKNPAYLPVVVNNVTTAAGSTQNPAHSPRDIKVELIAVGGTTTTFNGKVAYDSTKSDANYGLYVTSPTIDLGNIAAGPYTVKVTTDAHLRKTLGTKTIVVGQDNHINYAHSISDLIAGDITGDTQNSPANNKLDILDYNVLISCDIYGKDDSTCKLNTEFPRLSDLDDDGTLTTPDVDQYDYNLFLREFSIQHGD
jgi:hypothetical protein